MEHDFIGKGTIVRARADIFENVETWTVVEENPTKHIKNRIID